MKEQPAVVQHLRTFLQAHCLHEAGMVVAVSGGPDSVALLRALLAVRNQASGTAPCLVVAHLNHLLRPEESDTDEAFVRQLWAELSAAGATNLLLRTERIAVAEQARQDKENLEQAARTIRYAWLVRVARECGVGLVATGHTANDQAETVLHRLLRGSGLRGLRGIAPRRPLADDVEVLRPLLRVRRAGVLAYLEQLGQSYRVDRTNVSLEFTRNRIRHELLPHLAKHYNPAIVDVLGHLAKQARQDFVIIESEAVMLLKDAERPRAGAVLVFDRAVLSGAPEALLREVFRSVWEREGWPAGDMTFEHWSRLALLARGQSGDLQLPGGIRARIRARVVQLGPGE